MTIYDYIKEEKKSYRSLFVGIVCFIIIYTQLKYAFHLQLNEYAHIVTVVTAIGGFIYFYYFSSSRDISKRIDKIECPHCKEYIPLTIWKCPGCGETYDDRNIILGCKNCGTKIKKDKLGIGGMPCKNCNTLLSFFEEYNFKNWSVLGVGETSDAPTLVVKRKYPILIKAGLLCLYFTIVSLASSLYTIDKYGALVLYDMYVWKTWAVLSGLFFYTYFTTPLYFRILGYTPNRVKENPKYRREHANSNNSK